MPPSVVGQRGYKDKYSQALLQKITDDLKLSTKQKQDETNTEAINDEKDIQATLKNIKDEQALKNKELVTPNQNPNNNSVLSSIEDANKELVSKQTMEILEQGQIFYELANSIPCCNDIIKENESITDMSGSQYIANFPLENINIILSSIYQMLRNAKINIAINHNLQIKDIKFFAGKFYEIFSDGNQKDEVNVFDQHKDLILDSFNFLVQTSMSASGLFLPKIYKEGQRLDQYILCYSIYDTGRSKTFMKQMKEDKFISF